MESCRCLSYSLFRLPSIAQRLLPFFFCQDNLDKVMSVLFFFSPSCFHISPQQKTVLIVNRTKISLSFFFRIVIFVCFYYLFVLLVSYTMYHDSQIFSFFHGERKLEMESFEEEKRNLNETCC